MATTSCISGEGYWYPQILWWCSLSDGLRLIRVTLHKCCMGGCNPRGLSFPWMSSIELENWHFFEWRRFCCGICLENGINFQLLIWWTSGTYTPSRSVLLWDWGGGEVNSVRKLHGPSWTIEAPNQCTVCFHFHPIMNKLVLKFNPCMEQK